MTKYNRGRSVTFYPSFITFATFPNAYNLPLLFEENNMKDFISKPANFSRIEFWGATTIYVFSVFFLISYSLNIGLVQSRNPGVISRTPFDYYFVSKLIRYSVLYGAFLLLNLRIVPELIKKEALWLNIILTVILFLVIGLIFGTTSTFLKYELLPNSRTNRATHNILFQKGFLYAFWLLLLYGFYSVIKYTGLYLLGNSEAIQSRYRIITPGGLVAFVLWMISMFFLIIGGAPRDLVAIWSIIIPFGILFYWYSFHTLIPKAQKRKHPFRSFLIRVILVLILTGFPVAFLAYIISNDEDSAAGISTFNAAFHLFISAPFSWIWFKRYLQGNEEISHLKKELGQSNAHFDFLRSQINPHFLFNALNTIYGTALQEKAERTSEGIEKLGDMMRFMLQENMQDKISLAREIDYLNNYISLQKLRTDTNPIVNIEAHIEQPVTGVQIAPMLLIPFVENAFKHGISFREPSHIKVTLEVRDNVLYFDVYNSKHQKQETDPEKGKSGIGLYNVKQRLELLYPAKHELIIRETGKEFFVHLTIQLT